MAFPGTRQRRARYQTAKTVVDELGKGQEVLRHKSASVRNFQNTTRRQVIYVPEVDIIIVDIIAIGEGVTGVAAADTLDIIAPAAYDDAVAAGNMLCAQMTDTELADDTVYRAALSGLNGNRVAAGQPIIMVGEEAGNDAAITEIWAQVSFVLADESRTY